MDFTDEQLNIMHEYVKNMDGYNIIYFKGQISSILQDRGVARDDILLLLGVIGSDTSKAREFLNSLGGNNIR